MLTVVAPVIGEPAHDLPDGKLNPEWARWAYRRVTGIFMDVATGKNTEELPKGFTPAAMRDLLDAECKASGYDPNHLADTRTDIQKVSDAMRTLAETPDSITEKQRNILEEIKAQMDAADRLCGDILGARYSESTRDARIERELDEADAAREAAKKKWGPLIDLALELMDRARNPLPEKCWKGDADSIKAAWPLRLMCWVSRDNRGDVMLICQHHARMVCEDYQAYNQKFYFPAKGVWSKKKCNGIMQVCPPGHHKTTTTAHIWLGTLDLNPAFRLICLHANVKESEKNVRYLANFFDEHEVQGRRNLALFPEVKALKITTGKIELAVKERNRSAAVMAYGVNANASGADCDGLWEDDACDQKLASQETERVRLFDRLNGTWDRRLRTNNKRNHRIFTRITTTLWHHDDPNARRIGLARAGQADLIVCIQRCGGPDNDFKPLCPEILNAAQIRDIYQKMRNPRLFAACYQSNPQPEELRKIKRLAYYLPGSDTHRRFMESCIFHISLDPTATNREKSDKASFIYAGCGDVVTQKDGAQVYDRRLRILDGREFHANQTEGVAEVCHFAEQNPTHYVHVEVRSGFNASGEMFEARGLDPILHDPKNRKKELRLGDVAPMLDDSLRERGFPGAVIEFPGMLREDGTAGPDPDSPLAWLEKQILEFGVTADDHGLDALTQLAKHLGPELGVGEGAVTRQVRAAAPAGDPWIAKMLDYYGKPKDTRKTAGQEDFEFQVGAGDN